MTSPSTSTVYQTSAISSSTCITGASLIPLLHGSWRLQLGGAKSGSGSTSGWLVWLVFHLFCCVCHWLLLQDHSELLRIRLCEKCSDIASWSASQPLCCVALGVVDVVVCCRSSSIAFFLSLVAVCYY